MSANTPSNNTRNSSSNGPMPRTSSSLRASGAGTLQKMVQAAATHQHSVKWSHVLHYLKSHCVTADGAYPQLPFESPLKPYYMANPELKQKLQPDLTGHSVLRTAMQTAPSSIIAALCHLGPEAVTAQDRYGRLPLHSACRFAVSPETDAAMKVVIAAHPAGLLHRDHHGRTPLHYLFWYHANSRSPEIVAIFCQNLKPHCSEAFYRLQQPSPAASNNNNNNHHHHKEPPPLPEIPKPSSRRKVPYSAAIVPDAVHGCWPLHYAVHYGARWAVVQLLIEYYPASKHAVDRGGRTALHWYLGAGVGDEPSLSMTDPVTNNANSATTTGCRHQHLDPQQRQQLPVIDLALVQLLLSSRVARTIDCRGRTCLHWACWRLAHPLWASSSSSTTISPSSWNSDTSNSSSSNNFVSFDFVQTLLDTFAGQIFLPDEEGRTPCMVLFDTVYQIQQQQWEAAAAVTASSKHEYPYGAANARNLFSPPLELLQKLMEAPPGSTKRLVAATEDLQGRLPLHAAVQVAASPEIVQYVIEQFPTALVHTTDDATLHVPLHTAFLNAYTAPRQTAQIVHLLLAAYPAQGVTVDGRLALKMEDAAGSYPIHHACRNGASLLALQALCDRYPQTAWLMTPHGDLPVHCLFGNSRGEAWIKAATMTMTNSEEVALLLQDDEWKALPAKIRTLIIPLLADPSKLSVLDSKRRMLPLHVALLFDAVDYRLLLRLLELCPESASQFTGGGGGGGTSSEPFCYSPLDLLELSKTRQQHQQSKDNWNSDTQHEQWHRMRELVFSFSPRLESHRHRQELLDRCASLIVEEVEGGRSYHWRARHCRWDDNDENVEKCADVLDLELTHSVSNLMEKAAMMMVSTRGATARTKISHRSHRIQHKDSCRHRTIRNIREDDDVTEPSTKSRLPMGSSSIYDDDGTDLDYDFRSGGSDDDYCSSYGSHSTDRSHDDDDDDDTFTSDDRCTDDYSSSYRSNTTRSDTMGSRTFGSGTISHSLYTTSGSQLQTTFEDDGEDGMISREGSSVTDSANTHQDDRAKKHHEFDQRAAVIGPEMLFADTARRKSRPADTQQDLLQQPCASLDLSDAGDGQQHSLAAILNMANRIPNASPSEEKKDDEVVNSTRDLQSPKTPQRTNVSKNSVHHAQQYYLPPNISEVAMRLWTFFVLYCDPNNPSDHYMKQVASIIDDMKFSTVERLVSYQLPPFAEDYLHDREGVEGRCFRDVASPKCRELILKTCYFLGRYDLRTDRDILVHRSDDDTSVVLQVQEWIFTTEEATDARNPGISEANIWATGEVPVETGVTFRTHKRPVWIKFTKNEMEYENEVKRRITLGISVDETVNVDGLAETQKDGGGIVPILQHFNAFATERKIDRMYSCDIKDKRFRAVNLLEGQSFDDSETIFLDEYPFAIVYPAPPQGTLYDYFLRHGIRSEAQTKCIVTQVAGALQTIHRQGCCHGNVSIRNVVSASPTSRQAGRQWCLLDLSSTMHAVDNRLNLNVINMQNRQYMGGVTLKGFAQFKTETLPPEMFVKLNPFEFKKYLFYWSSVERRFGVEINRKVVEPFVDVHTGEAFVPRCHFIPLSVEESQEILPYKLLPASPSTDLWALGHLLFLLISGRPLAEVFPRDGRLVHYKDICPCDPAPVVLEHISNPLAQDLLLKLLGSQDSRLHMTIKTVLEHPFLSQSSENQALAEKISEELKHATASHARRLDKKRLDDSEKKVSDARSFPIKCWDFGILERIHLSPTELVHRMSARSRTSRVPCSFIILPYNFYAPKQSVEASELTERFGREMIQLSKACYFTSVMKQATSNYSRSGNPPQWSSTDMLRVLDLSSSEFGDIQSQMAEMAATHVEVFRNDPIAIAIKMVQEKVGRILALFEDRSVFLYFVDEFYCTPVADCQPIEVVGDWRTKILSCGILFMHICTLYARGVSKGLEGLAKLLFQTTDGAHVPPSWKVAASGLLHDLNESKFYNELKLLEDALSEMFSTQYQIGDGALDVIRDFLMEVDPGHRWGGLQRVVTTEASIWTTNDGVNELKELSAKTSFQDSLRHYKELEDKLEQGKAHQ